MNKVYLLIGGNLGDVAANLKKAQDLIRQEVGNIVDASSLYRTSAWGIKDQPDFLNQVLEVATEQAAELVLENILRIEKLMGRVRLIKNGPRLIDIDILLYNEDIIHTPILTIPHPLLHKRNFTLFPLAQIAPDLLHPLLRKTIYQLLEQSEDTLAVEKLVD